MPTIDPLSSNTAAWLRQGVGRLRRAMIARHPAVRLALVAATVLALAALGYWVAGTLAPTVPRRLGGGRPFASDDLITICKALDARGISYRPDDAHRITVAAEQYDQAAAIVAKLDIGPHSFSEIREAPGSFSDLLLTSEDRQQRDRLRQEKLIERAINELPGVVWSLASIQHPRTKWPRAARTRPSAFVYLECEPNRPLPLQTVQAIPAIVTGLSNEPELSADAIKVVDRGGRVLLDPHNPNLGRETRARVREQELRDRVGELLSWIAGVRILLVPGDRGQPLAAPGSSAGQTTRAADAEAEAPAAEQAPPTIAVNEPAGLDELPLPAAHESAVSENAAGGRLYVYVPRSYYYLATPRPEHREPTFDELQQVAARTRQRVERILKPPVIPESWTVDVETLPDEVPMTRSASLPAGANHRRFAADWRTIGAAAAAVILLLALGLWIQAARRPVRVVESAATGRRYRDDSPDEPEPSERVRELVRRNPEVAASVLERWATQGGRVA